MSSEISEDKLANTLLARNCRNVVNITATQYTGEEFFQGGLNQKRMSRLIKRDTTAAA